MGSAGGLLLSAEPVNVPPGGPRLVPGDIFSVAGQTQLGVWGDYSFATECFLPLGSRSLPYYTLTALLVAAASLPLNTQEEEGLAASLSALKPQPAKKWNIPPLQTKVLLDPHKLKGSQ